MGARTIGNLKTKNRNFDNILDSFLNLKDGGTVTGAMNSKKLVINPGNVASFALDVSSSGAVVILSHSAAVTVTLPAVANGSGIEYTFKAASAHAHVVSASAQEDVIYGTITDNGNGTTVASDHHAAQNNIALANPLIGDCITVVGDGTSWHINGFLNDTPVVDVQ